MKSILLLVALGASFVTSALAEFRTWTRHDGKTADLELVSVKSDESDPVGTFKMRSGKTVELKASALAEADAKLLADWKPTESAAATPAAGTSVFDEILEGNLVRLSGKSLRACKDATKPTKCYVFYYTASWCGPCQAYTPTLVDFYEKNKSPKFEIILITRDTDEEEMETYAKEKKMPWPLLKLSKVEKFQKAFNHNVNGIPSVIVCDLQGKVLADTQSLEQILSLVK